MIFFTKKRELLLREELCSKVSSITRRIVEQIFKKEYRQKIEHVIGELERGDGKWIDSWYGEEMDSLLIEIMKKIMANILVKEVDIGIAEAINGEEFIDTVIERINRKQLK